MSAIAGPRGRAGHVLVDDRKSIGGHVQDRYAAPGSIRSNGSGQGDFLVSNEAISVSFVNFKSH